MRALAVLAACLSGLVAVWGSNKAPFMTWTSDANFRVPDMTERIAIVHSAKDEDHFHRTLHDLADVRLSQNGIVLQPEFARRPQREYRLNFIVRPRSDTFGRIIAHPGYGSHPCPHFIGWGLPIVLENARHATGATRNAAQMNVSPQLSLGGIASVPDLPQGSPKYTDGENRDYTRENGRWVIPDSPPPTGFIILAGIAFLATGPIQLWGWQLRGGGRRGLGLAVVGFGVGFIGLGLAAITWNGLLLRVILGWQ